MKILKFYRLICEKTQRELAKEVGCTQPLISMFENEKLYPGPIFKDALSKALNLPKDEILVLAQATVVTEPETTKTSLHGPEFSKTWKTTKKGLPLP